MPNRQCTHRLWNVSQVAEESPVRQLELESVLTAAWQSYLRAGVYVQAPKARSMNRVNECIGCSQHLSFDPEQQLAEDTHRSR